MDSNISGTVTVPTKLLHGKRYGSKPVNISFGGTDLGPGHYAVVCDDLKWVSTRDDCQSKLVQWGLTSTEAELVLDLGDALDSKKESVPPLDEQEAQGLYDEEVQKMRDGLLEDIKAGGIKSRAIARERLTKACALSSYGTDIQFASVAIRFTNGYIAESLALSRHIMYDDVMCRLLMEKDYKKLPERQ